MWKKNEKNRWKIVLHCNVLFPLKLSKWHTFQEDLSPEHCHSSQCRPRTLCSKPYPVCREARDLFTDDKSPIYGSILHNYSKKNLTTASKGLPIFIIKAWKGTVPTRHNLTPKQAPKSWPRSRSSFGLLVVFFKKKNAGLLGVRSGSAIDIDIRLYL